MSNSTEYIYILNRMLELHTVLCETLELEFACFVQADHKELVEVVATKEAVVQEIYKLENLRLSIAQSADALPETPAETQLKKLLRERIEHAKDLNQRNMGFASEAIERIEFLKRNALGISNETSRENYSSQGARYPTPEQGGRLLSTEA